MERLSGQERDDSRDPGRGGSNGKHGKRIKSSRRDRIGGARGR
jgi:hypothetical protein